MKILFVSNLFPNYREPERGVFNYQQVRHLARRCEVRVVAPIAWFFIRGGFAPPAPVPASETIGGLAVDHPRSFYLPKIGRTLNPLWYAWSTRSRIGRIYRDFPFEVIYVNWAYPDACGIARVARWFHVPFVVSISGSDANSYLTFRIRRRQILAMLDRASAIVVRSGALRQLLVAHGVPEAKLHVLYNGVDPFNSRANPGPMPGAASQLDPAEPILLYVGRLSPEKGVADLLAALALLRDRDRPVPRLLVVGEGRERDALHQQARTLGLDPNILWIGRKRPEEIASYLAAADLVCLPSHMEGVPNAALEAFSCGRPVVASRVGGLPEIVTDATGILAEPRQPAALADAIDRAFGRTWSETAIREHARQFDWTENARRLHEILRRAPGTFPQPGTNSS